MQFWLTLLIFFPLFLLIRKDLHTAPGSQNGFDNSGHLSPIGPTCAGWCDNKDNIARTKEILKEILVAIKDAGITDVVTGFGPLNEPFVDCDFETVQQYYNETMFLVKEYLGPESSVYIGDAFSSKKWNTGWWLNSNVYNNTYLDSHYYHGEKHWVFIFDERNRLIFNLYALTDL